MIIRRAIAGRVAVVSKRGDSLLNSQGTDLAYILACEPYSLIDRRRSAFTITETELKLIAAPAIIGLRSSPMNG